MRSRISRLILALTGFVASSALAAPAGNWPSFGRDVGSQRYSPLTQITPSNVSDLQVAWTYHMNPAHETAKSVMGRAPASETTPLVIDGVMYLSTPYARVVALDAETGTEIWTYQLPAGEQTPLRGIGYWPGDKQHPAEIVTGTSKGNIIALSAQTGRPAEGFGSHGILDTKT